MPGARVSASLLAGMVAATSGSWICAVQTVCPHRNVMGASTRVPGGQSGHQRYGRSSAGGILSSSGPAVAGVSTAAGAARGGERRGAGEGGGGGVEGFMRGSSGGGVATCAVGAAIVSGAGGA